jgi:hypothetical protein
VVLVVVAAVAGVLLCRLADRDSKPWIPVLEPTGFEYLDASASRALEEVLAAHARIRAQDQEGAAESLDRAVDAMIKLERYFIPLTEVRELVYDADRLFYLGETNGAKQKLEQAKHRLLGVASLQKASFLSAVEEAVLKIDELLLALDGSRPEAGELLGEVGHRVNLMVLKGDLVLANVQFGVEDAKR